MRDGANRQLLRPISSTVRGGCCAASISNHVDAATVAASYFKLLPESGDAVTRDIGESAAQITDVGLNE